MGPVGSGTTLNLMTSEIRRPPGMKLVIYPPVDEVRLEHICSAVKNWTVVNADSESAALQAISNADCFFGKMTRELLNAADELKWIQSPTASLEHYMFPELAEHASVLTNMRGLFSDVIADQVIGYVICFARQLVTYIRQQAEGNWAPVGGEEARSDFKSGPGQISPIDLKHRQLQTQTLGIVGLGEIGQELARRAAAFGMKIVAVDPQDGIHLKEVTEVWKPAELDRLLAISDYVVICAPHTPSTVGMFSRRELQMMRAEAYLINIGRGALVKLDDLVASLSAGEIAGAALDVFEIEPLPKSHPLWTLDNVILTPHIAGYAPCIAQRHLKVLLDNLQAFDRGETLQNQVDKRLWY